MKKQILQANCEKLAENVLWGLWENEQMIREAHAHLPLIGHPQPGSFPFTSGCMILAKIMS